MAKPTVVEGEASKDWFESIGVDDESDLPVPSPPANKRKKDAVLKGPGVFCYPLSFAYFSQDRGVIICKLRIYQPRAYQDRGWIYGYGLIARLEEHRPTFSDIPPPSPKQYLEVIGATEFGAAPICRPAITIPPVVFEVPKATTGEGIAPLAPLVALVPKKKATALKPFSTTEKGKGKAVEAPNKKKSTLPSK